MGIGEIIKYFGETKVYKFNGTPKELSDIMISGHNYIIVEGVVYFTTETIVTDSRITEISGE
jgi:hypothetical protein